MPESPPGLKTWPTAIGAFLRRASSKVLDMLAAGLLLILIAPLMLVLALGIRLGTKDGPVVYRDSSSTGFTVLKFRSMRSRPGVSPALTGANLAKRATSIAALYLRRERRLALRAAAAGLSGCAALAYIWLRSGLFHSATFFALAAVAVAPLIDFVIARLRFECGFLGSNEREARDLVSYVIDNSDEFDPGGGNLEILGDQNRKMHTQTPRGATTGTAT